MFFMYSIHIELSIYMRVHLSLPWIYYLKKCIFPFLFFLGHCLDANQKLTDLNLSGNPICSLRVSVKLLSYKYFIKLWNCRSFIHIVHSFSGLELVVFKQTCVWLCLQRLRILVLFYLINKFFAVTFEKIMNL